MSSGESPEISSAASEAGRLRRKADEIAATDDGASPIVRESEYAGLRNLQEQKEKWSNLLRWVLILSFVIQAVMLVAVLFGRPLDDWTVRAVLLQFTAMFIAALRFLFR